MTRIAIVYHSGFGHTKAVAESVAAGARTRPDTEVRVVSVEELIEPADTEGGSWPALHGADAIVFGSPTYMGTVSAPFKQFMDMSSTAWMKQAWAGKLAAGFTNSGSPSGDKVNTLETLAIFAAQHSMVWAPAGVPADPAAGVNRLGGYLGLMTQSDEGPADVTPPAEDHETARRFGASVARAAARWRAGAQEGARA